MPEPLPFEFIVRGPPVSFQVKNRKHLASWKHLVAEAAREAWPAGEPPLIDEVTVVITSFYANKSPDVDNIVKPVHNALSSIVYEDDGQISQSTVRKSPVGWSFDLGTASPALIEALDRRQDVLLVRILPGPDHENIL